VLEVVLAVITLMPIIYADLAWPTVFFAIRLIAVLPVPVATVKVFP
jgi:hypothetical protein